MTSPTSLVPPLNVETAPSSLARDERLVAFELLDSTTDYTWKWYLATIQSGSAQPAPPPPQPPASAAASVDNAATTSPTHSGLGSPRVADVTVTRVVEVQRWHSAGSLADTLTAGHNTDLAAAAALPDRLATPRDSTPTTATASPRSSARPRRSTARGGDADDDDDASEAPTSRGASTSPGRAPASSRQVRPTQGNSNKNNNNGDEDDEEALAQTLTQTHALLEQLEHTPRSAEGKRLAQEIATKRVAFDARAAEIKANMTEMRKERDEAIKAQGEAEQVYKRSQKELRKARKNVEQLDPKHMREVQTYRTPPPVVQWVMKGVMVAIGDSARDWRDITSVMRSPNFIHSVVAFEPANLTSAQKRELVNTYVVKPKFTADEVSKGSEAVAPLYEWIVKELDMGDAVEQLEAVRAEETKRRERVDAIRARISSSANELESMEDELRDLLDDLQRCEEEAARRDEQDAARALTSPLDADDDDGSPSLTTLEGGVKVPRQLMRGAFRTWRRAQNAESDLTRVLRSSILCDLGPSPGPGASLTLSPEQRGQLEHALANRLSQNASLLSQPSAGEASHTSSSAMGKAPGQTAPGTAPKEEQDAAHTEAEEDVLEQRVMSLLDTLEAADDLENEPQPGASAATGAAEAEATAAAPALSPRAARLTHAVDVADRHVVAMKAQLAAQQAKLSQLEDAQLQAAQRNPLCENEATTVTHCRKVFDGDEWNIVMEDSPDTLTTAFTNDVAMICRVPNQRVTNVSFLVGSLHVDFDVEHDARLSGVQVQDAVDMGEYPETFALYADRHHSRVEKQQQLQRRQRSASMPNRDSGHDTPSWPPGLPPPLSEGGMGSSGAQVNSGRVGLADSGDSAQLSPRFPLVDQTSSQMEFVEEQREQRAFSGMVREAQRLNAKLDEKNIQIEESQQQVKEAESRLRQLEVEHARVQDELRQEIECLNDRVEELQSLHASETHASRLEAQQSVHQQNSSASAAATAGEGRATRALAADVDAPLTTTHCHKVFDGDDWPLVLEDSPDELARALTDDIALACGVPNRSVQNLAMTSGSLHVDVDVQHPSSVDGSEIERRVEEASYDSVTAVYAGRRDRRQAKQAEEAKLASLHAAKQEAEAKLAAQQAELEAVKAAQEKQKEAALDDLRRQLEAKTKEVDKAHQAERAATAASTKLQNDLFEKENELLGMENELREARHAQDVEHDALVRTKRELADELQQQQAAYMAEMNRLHDQVTETAKAKDKAIEETRRVAEAQARERELVAQQQQRDDAVAKATAALEEAAKVKDLQQQSDSLEAADTTLSAALESDIAAKDAAIAYCEKEPASLSTQSAPPSNKKDATPAHAARLERFKAGIADIEAAQAAAAAAAGQTQPGAEATTTTTKASEDLAQQKAALADDLAQYLEELSQASKASRDAAARTHAAWQKHDAALKRAAEQVEQARKARSTLDAEVMDANANSREDKMRHAAIQRSRQPQKARINELETVSETRGRAVAQAIAQMTEAQEARVREADEAIRNVEAVFGLAPSSDTGSPTSPRARGVAMNSRAALLADIYADATRRATSGNENFWRNACFVGMLVVGLATLEYKKYAV